VFPGEAKAGEFSAAAKAQVPGPVEARFLDPARPRRRIQAVLADERRELWTESRAGHFGREGDRVSSITTDLAGLSGTLALLLIAALVFGETAVFLGFVIPGETAAVLGGVLASRGRVSLPLLIIVVVAAAVTGPLIGYEIGRHLGGRVIAARRMRRVASGMDRAQAVVHRRGGLAVLLGRFVAILRAVVPAVAGTTRMPYRTFLIYNMLGGLIWGIGYCLLGYVAGSAYAAIERTVGTGVAIVVAVAVLGGLGFWLVRRHRREQASPGAAGPGAAGLDAAGPDEAGLDAAGLDTPEPGVAGADGTGPDGAGPGAAGPGPVRPPGPERPR
jgi:membrane-associated protein